ncbi:hypothetical protein PAMA_016154 [Pampus argenteus]
MGGVQYLVCLCMLLMTQSRFVYSEIQFIRMHEGDSVVFPCAVEQKNPPPFSVYLKRNWLNPGEVLFMLSQEEYNVHNDHDKTRIHVSGDPSDHSLNVTISELTVSDTDRYYCEFVVNNPVSEDERIPGNTEFVLLVSAGTQCLCSSSTTLLYALSAAVVILLLLLGFVGIYVCRCSEKPRPQVSVYEEMHAFNQKRVPHNQEVQYENKNSFLKKSCPENHYESPTGSSRPRNES